MAHPDYTITYANGATAAFSVDNPARWILPLGAGAVSLTNAGDADGVGTSTFTATLPAGVPVTGEWTALVSTSCSYLVVGSSPIPPGPQPSIPTLIPATSLQQYLTDSTAHASAFSVAPGYVHFINPSGATFAYSFPAITSSNDGQRLAVVNVSTGTTATVAAPNGSDNVGNSAGAATGATAAGPTGGAVKVYVANLTRTAWLVGI